MSVAFGKRLSSSRMGKMAVGFCGVSGAAFTHACLEKEVKQQLVVLERDVGPADALARVLVLHGHRTQHKKA